MVSYQGGKDLVRQGSSRPDGRKLPDGSSQGTLESSRPDGRQTHTCLETAWGPKRECECMCPDRGRARAWSPSSPLS